MPERETPPQFRTIPLPKHWDLPPAPLVTPEAPKAEAEPARQLRRRVLVADDDPVSREVVRSVLTAAQYEVVTAADGDKAMKVFRSPGSPELAILDWMMPGMDGVEICRRVRATDKSAYLILLTALSSKDNIVEALAAGADDYLVKPFNHSELNARILVGWRVLDLQRALAARVKELEEALGEIRELKLQIPL